MPVVCASLLPKRTFCVAQEHLSAQQHTFDVEACFQHTDTHMRLFYFASAGVLGMRLLPLLKPGGALHVTCSTPPVFTSARVTRGKKRTFTGKEKED